MFNLLEKEIGNRSITENGAVGYRSSGSALVDLNYMVSSLRNTSTGDIEMLFHMAYMENREYALKWLFFARDIRGGLGERRLFRIIYKYLAWIDRKAFIQNLPIVAEYGRWDDVISMLGIRDELDTHILYLVQCQLNEDLDNMRHNKPVSLLAKWLPSENASSPNTRMLAKKVRKGLGLSSKDYRKMLSQLRGYSNVVEVQLCANEWDAVDYEKVPSLANLKYRRAFLRNDEDRRIAYLDSVKKGGSKLNMSVANPVDVVTRYSENMMLRREVKPLDETLELAWKNLSDVNIEDTLVVADGSGSMTMRVSGKTTALDVANALAIYTSEHNKGEYKDKYITFSHTPQFVDLSNRDTLKHKLETARKYNEVANTNIEAVFELILAVAVKHNVPKEEMIKNVLIISDMEFDSAQKGFRTPSNPLTPALFEKIKETYNDLGYDLPKLIFWNVNSRTKTIPLIENELGVTLVSGFSQNVLRMVMSNKYDPWAVLKETLDNPRYDKVQVQN